MLKPKLYFAIILLTSLSLNFAVDFYSRFHQNDYKIDFLRMELIDYDKSVFNIFEIKTFKYNRTQPVWNITINFKLNISSELEMAVQVYKFLSNEYRELLGTNFQLNYCKGITANIIGALTMVSKCGNFSKCGFVQGVTYKLCNAYPDELQSPPFFPNGEFKVQSYFVYGDKIISTVDMYYKVYRPVARPGKRKTVY